MKKICFNDRYSLTQAVIEGRKTMFRREVASRTGSFEICLKDGVVTDIWQTDADGRTGDDLTPVRPRYKVGEVVAVAQSYQNAGLSREYINNDPFGGLEKGWLNKMFVRADLMPHRIRITGIRCERLQEISNDDCLREGVRVEYAPNGRAGYYFFDTRRMRERWFNTPREALASLIDKVSGRGTWNRNPWVFVYDLELVK